MSYGVNMTIVNNTSYDLVQPLLHLAFGIAIQSPPATIQKGTTATFSITPDASSVNGSVGSLTYTLSIANPFPVVFTFVCNNQGANTATIITDPTRLDGKVTGITTTQHPLTPTYTISEPTM